MIYKNIFDYFKQKFNKQFFKIVIALFISNVFIFIQNTNSQNLAPNSSFELTFKCPVDYTQWNETFRRLVPGWEFPTKGTPDYFNRCCKSMAGVPRNFAGGSEPVSGDGYIGMILKGSRKNYREYVQGRLNESLEEGVKYCVSFHLKLSSKSIYATDQFGIYFAEEQVSSNTQWNLPFKPQIVNEEGVFYDNKEEWLKFCSTFVAKGGEQYMIIGNFMNDDSTETIEADVSMVKERRRKDYAYYFIDDVQVNAIKDCYVCSCSWENIISGETEVKDALRYAEPSGEIKLKPNGGIEPYTFQWSNDSTTKDITELYAGEYRVTITDKKGCKGYVTAKVEQPDIIFSKVEDNVPKILKNVYFYFDKTVLLPKSYKQLNHLVFFMNDFPDINVVIQGHTDNYGTPDYNIDLSQNRAKVVVEYLIEKGIAKERLSYDGFGETKPIATNDTDEGRQQNRRVEFMVVK